MPKKLFDPITDDYDTSHLIKLAKEQYPQFPRLAEQLAKCKIVKYPHCLIDLNNTYYLRFFEYDIEEYEGDILLYDKDSTFILGVYSGYRVSVIEYLDMDLRECKTLSFTI